MPTRAFCTCRALRARTFIKNTGDSIGLSPKAIPAAHGSNGWNENFQIAIEWPDCSENGSEVEARLAMPWSLVRYIFFVDSLLFIAVVGGLCASQGAAAFYHCGLERFFSAGEGGA
ncbi:MAG: hypothetical protein HOC91_16715 [Nitrospinaceae bacterium]|nr:hypothetical protein [Nitrospinaceae bacterium]MBT4432154.1 hypothetical protein [Nitrospinaceae bacterium]